MANSTVCQSKWKPIVEPRRAKPKTYPNRRRAIREWRIAINNDWDDNQACSLPHNIQAIAILFITVDKFSELLRKIRFSYNFSKSAH